MKIFKRSLSLLLISAMILSICSCAKSDATSGNLTSGDLTSNDLTSDVPASPVVETDSGTDSAANSAELTLNSSGWQYDADNEVYWQIGVVYCATPAAAEYESMGIYVPAAYMSGTDNSDGTYTCTINTDGTVNGYTAETAPIVIPVNTAGYSAQSAPTSYSYNDLSSYLDAGYIYVYAGCRGRDNGYDSSDNLTYSGGAPWGVTDLKAAVRYLRYNDAVIPGDTDRIFTFGHSGGGAQSSLMGATGDSELYFKYLESIGAAMYDDNGNYISDAICGAMCWCPITSLDYADEAYEWMMGQYATTGTRADSTWTSALSDDLSQTFAAYINELGLTDENGTVLLLSPSESGVYTSGSYYDYLLSEVERSLNNFLSDTEFPYTSGADTGMADGGFPGGASGNPPSGDLPSGSAPSGDLPSGNPPSDGNSVQDQSGTSSVTYQSAQDYIDSLNSDEDWVVYDAATNTAKITSVEAFVSHCKNASKDVGAFDSLDRSAAENKVFGDDENDALHFDSVMAKLLEENQSNYAAFSDWDESYVNAYQEYLTSTDALGSDSLTRQNIYNPMYYLCKYYDGYGTSTVASHWRIHTGIEQGDTASTVEMNLALALKQCESVKDVDFEMVWAQGHTTAERAGNSTDNFIQWVNECCA